MGQGKKIALNEIQRKELEDLGFDWNVQSNNKGDNIGSPWIRMIAELQAYKKKHGNCNVPNDYAPNPKLVKWVTKQKKKYAQLKILGLLDRDDTKTNEMVIEEDIQAQRKRKQKMNKSVNESAKIGKVVKKKNNSSSADAEKSDKWEKNYENLKKYKEEHGDCLVPKDYKDFPR